MPKRAREEDEDIEVGEAPTTINPYKVLSVETDATQDDIKKAYRKAALKYHPDKVSAEEKATAHTKFQEIAFAYAILSDERRRKRYDTTGSTDESLDLEDDDFDWVTYYREQFQGIVTQETIQNFTDQYRGSGEEAEAVIDAYTKHQGSMTKLYHEVMLSDMTEDDDRFRAIIDQAIADGKVESFDKYTKEKEATRRKRIAQARKNKEKEAPEAAEAAHEMQRKAASKKSKKTNSGDDTAGLAALIQQRQKDRAGNFFDQLEAKYAPKAKKAKGGAMDEPPEEAFARNAQKKKKKRT